MNDLLLMKFDPNTIEHLGVKMYSRIPTAIAELIANSYDADATEVTIYLENGENKKIVVEDNGSGMTFDELNTNFLRIGRNRRDEGDKKSPSGRRKATGKKGLGKLALFGIGDLIEIETKKGEEKVKFSMDWEKLKNTHNEDYKPELIAREKIGKGDTGTKISLSSLKRKNDFNAQELASSLSKLFNCFDSEFKVYVQLGDEKISVDNELKYSQIDNEFTFEFPKFLRDKNIDHPYKDEIKGSIFTTKKPLRPGMRGITLFANGRMVNAPEFFGKSESSHFYSYVTGWLEADFLDNWEEDVISTNRQSLNWETQITSELKETLQGMLSEMERDWRDQRGAKRREELKEKTQVDVPEWYGKLPREILTNVEPLMDAIIDKSEMEDEEQTKIVKRLHSIVPEYPYYHWRHLHRTIKEASEEDYQKTDYYRAFLEAAKRYLNEVRRKSSAPSGDVDARVVSGVFGENKKLLVSKKYKKPCGNDFEETTLKNIEEGQKFLSMGIVAGGRNPVSHEEIKDLRESGLFTEKDCLDGLSLLSHLYRRLQDAEINESHSSEEA